MNNIVDNLFKMQDQKYKEFQAKLVPNISFETIIGVRTSNIREYAKKLIKEENYKSFLENLPHKYFEENQLHAFIISELKNYDECMIYLNNFLPYVDNWATSDQMSPKIFKKYHYKLLDQIKIWIKSNKTYTIRFGIGMLMKYFLDDNFKVEYLKLVSNIKSKEYYVNMMRAWFFSTALIKQYESAIIIIKDEKLDTWTHNKTIQKAIESYKISNDKKEYLRSLKKKM